MAVFYNRASLSYNGNTVNSNIVTGEIIQVLSGDKTAVPSTYSEGDEVTYVISIVNSGATPFTSLTVTDNLGEYAFGSGTVVPLTYVPYSVRLFVDGVLQTTPAVTDAQPLTVSGVGIPANGNAILIYRARVNQFAPLGTAASIVNSAVISGTGLAEPVTVTETITAETGLDLDITKALNPETVAENGEITYTFTIRNSGAVPASATDNLIVTDNFDPILDISSVTFNGTPWTEPANYTYNEATGLFSTAAGQITVPAATYTQDPVTGAYAITPGTSILRVTGTI